MAEHLRTAARTLFLLAGLIAQSGPTERVIGWPPEATSGSISADTQWISFVDKAGELNVWNIRERTGRRLTNFAGTGAASRPLISHDGKLVAFSGQTKGEGAGLRLVSAGTPGLQTPRLLLKGNEIAPRDWSADGSSLLVTTESGRNFDVGVVRISDGSHRVLKSIPISSSLRFLALSRDGAWVAYDAPIGRTVWHRAVYLISTASGGEREVLSSPHWNSVVGFSPDGASLLVLSNRSGSNDLLAIPIADGKPTGSPRVLNRALAGFPRGVTDGGGVFYDRLVEPPRARLFRASIDAAGQATGTAVPIDTLDRFGFHRDPRWSADGRSFLYITSSPVGPQLVVHTDAVREPRRIPLTESVLRTFDWSPDGTRVVFRTGEGAAIVNLLTGETTAWVRPANTEYFHAQFNKSGDAIGYFKLEGSGSDLSTKKASYVERPLNSSEERTIHADLSTLWFPNRYPAGRSPDGRYLLAMVYKSDLPTTLYAYDTQDAQVRDIFRVNEPAALNHYGDLRWLPDGRSVVGSVKNAKGVQELWWIPVDGRAAKKLEVGVPVISEIAVAVHPSGREIAFVAGAPVPPTASLLAGPRDVGARTELRLIEGLLRGGR